MKSHIHWLASLALLILLGGGCGDGSSNEDNNAPLVATRLVGMNFGPYLDGQSPAQGTQISEQQLRTRLNLIASETQWIRTYSTRSGTERAGGVAHSLGLKAALGAFLSRDATANEQEITNLISVAQMGDADLVIVGSEVLQREDLSPTELIGFINRVKQALPGRIITTADPSTSCWKTLR